MSTAFQPFLVNEKIILRCPQVSDFEQWAHIRYSSRDHLTRWENRWEDHETSRSAFRQRLKFWRRQERIKASLALFVLRQADETLVGGVTLTNIRYGGAQSAILGYWIGAAYTNQGYGGLAVESVLSHAFGPIGLHRVAAACQPENHASQRLLIRTGFSLEGRARDYLLINGEWRDHDIYAITAPDWRRR